MFYEKSYAMRKPERKKIPLSNFAGYDENKISRTLPCDYTNCVFNYGFKNNKLVNPYGVSEFKIGNYSFPPLPEIIGEKGVFCSTMYINYEAKFTALISHEGGVEYCTEGDKEWRHFDLKGAFTSAAIFYVDSKPCIFLAGDTGIRWLASNEFMTAITKKVLDVCVHYERMFAVVKEERNSVWFSAVANAMSWTHSIDKGGFIAFDGTLGEVNVIKSFNNYLYIFCDYGIYRLTAYGDQSQFVLKKIYTASGRIFAKSVTVCGEYIAFAGEDGIFLFDGYDVSRYTTKINDMISSGFEDIYACYLRNKYVVSFTNKTPTDFGIYNSGRDNEMLLVFDITDKSVTLMRGAPLKYLCAVNEKDYSKVVALCDDCDTFVELDESGLYLGKPMLKYWESGTVDFERPSEEKLLKSVEYSTKNRIYLGVIANGVRREFLLSPREKIKSLNVKGKEFKFYIKSDNANEEIYPPTMVVDFLK